jgi:hypothetical protein
LWGIRPGLITTFRCDAPRVAARSSMSGASWWARAAAKRSTSPPGQCGSADCHESGRARTAAAARGKGADAPHSAEWPPTGRSSRRPVRIATFRCDAPARCGAFADARRWPRQLPCSVSLW